MFLNYPFLTWSASIYLVSTHLHNNYKSHFGSDHMPVEHVVFVLSLVPGGKPIISIPVREKFSVVFFKPALICHTFVSVFLSFNLFFMTAEYNLSVLDYMSISQATAALHPSPLFGSSSTVFQSFLECFEAHLCSHATKARLVNLQHYSVHSSTLIWTLSLPCWNQALPPCLIPK